MKKAVERVPEELDRKIDAYDESHDDAQDWALTITEVEPHLVGVDTCIAKCLRVEPPIAQYFGGDESRYRALFWFLVLFPESYHGTKLKMWVECDPNWHRLAEQSKLRKLIRIAGGRVSRGKLRLTPIFQGKIFKCQLKHVGPKGSLPDRTIIETLIAKEVEL